MTSLAHPGVPGLSRMEGDHARLTGIMSRLRTHIQDMEWSVARIISSRLFEELMGHMDDEEAIMARYDYPHVTRHLRIHDQLRASLIRLDHEMEREPLRTDDLAQAFHDVAQRFLGDIREEDGRLATYLRQLESQALWIGSTPAA